ncbi:MAG: fumarate reductase subunit FrdD [Chromatocurvus sp.]
MNRPLPPRSREPVVWSLFGAGGMLLAFLGPALVLMTLLVLPGLFADDAASVYQALLAALRHPLGLLVALATLSLTFFHTLHRICHGLHDLHVPLSAAVVSWACYGLATMLSLLAGIWLLGL